MLEDRSFVLSLSVDADAGQAGWPAVEALGVELARRAPAELVGELLRVRQQRLLTEVCGPRWRPVRGVPAPFSCPRCGAEEDFGRKGHRARPRRLDTAFGTVRIRLAQVRCRCCGRVFAPLLRMLGLEGVRRTDRLALQLTELSTQMSYGRAATVAGDVGGLPATAGRAHASLADIAGLLGDLGPATLTPDVVLLDGTGARAGDDRYGVGVNLAVGLVGRSGPLRRRRAHREWLAATVDEPWESMVDRLADVRPPHLVVVDGEEAVTAVAQRLWPTAPVQRCWWHLPHGLIKAGYREERRPLMRWVRGHADRLAALPARALAEDWTLDDALAAWDDLADLAHYPALHAYLAAARPHAFTFLDPALQQRLAHLGGVDLGTGVIERDMRELNARTDIGGSRWTVAGLRDLVVVHTARRLNHPAWNDLHKEINQPNTIRSELCQKVNG